MSYYDDRRLEEERRTEEHRRTMENIAARQARETAAIAEQQEAISLQHQHANLLKKVELGIITQEDYLKEAYNLGILTFQEYLSEGIRLGVFDESSVLRERISTGNCTWEHLASAIQNSIIAPASALDIALSNGIVTEQHHLTLSYEFGFTSEKEYVSQGYDVGLFTWEEYCIRGLRLRMFSAESVAVTMRKRISECKFNPGTLDLAVNIRVLSEQDQQFFYRFIDLEKDCLLGHPEKFVNRLFALGFISEEEHASRLGYRRRALKILTLSGCAMGAVVLFLLMY